MTLPLSDASATCGSTRQEASHFAQKVSEVCSWRDVLTFPEEFARSTIYLVTPAPYRATAVNERSLKSTRSETASACQNRTQSTHHVATLLQQIDWQPEEIRMFGRTMPIPA